MRTTRLRIHRLNFCTEITCSKRKNIGSGVRVLQKRKRFSLSVDYETQKNKKTHETLQKGVGWVYGIKNPWSASFNLCAVSRSFGWTKRHAQQQTHTNTLPAPCVPDHYPHRAPDIMSVVLMSVNLLGFFSIP